MRCFMPTLCSHFGPTHSNALPDRKLFPQLKSFKQETKVENAGSVKGIEYKTGELFGKVKNKIFKIHKK